LRRITGGHAHRFRFPAYLHLYSNFCTQSKFVHSNFYGFAFYYSNSHGLAFYYSYARGFADEKTHSDAICYTIRNAFSNLDHYI